MTETQSSHPLQPDAQIRIAVSLRAKFLLGVLIVLVTVAGIGYFVFTRLQAANESLVQKFDASVAREIENRLTIIATDEANSVSLFFASMENVINTFGSTTGMFISNEGAVIPEESDWNAYNELSKLPGGSWDNADDELASIFLPAGMEINESLAKELTALKDLDFFTQGLLEEYPEIVALYFGGKTKETIHYPNVDLAAIVPPDYDITSQSWYVNAADLPESNKEAVWSAPYQDAALNGLVITSSVPVFDTAGTFRGVAGIDFQLAAIIERITNLTIGETGYGFLVDTGGRVIAMSRKGYDDFNLTEEDFLSVDIENLSMANRVSLDVFEVLAKMTGGQTGVQLVEVNGSNRYIAYKPVPVVGYSLGIIVSEDELLQEFVNTRTVFENETRQTIFNAVTVFFILMSVAGLAAYGIGSSITAPLEKLTRVAEDIASGNLDSRATIKTRDEVGVMGNALNNMASNSQELITMLNNALSERTHSVERRTAHIEAVAEVSQAIAALHALEDILLRTTHQISNRFGFYHVGIFLVDAHNEYALLQAANSAGGAKMLARGHKLRVGSEGIVGMVTDTGRARIALDVGEDAVYFDNPDLPRTHSEMALPLIAGGEILGALDLQSVEINAFVQDDIPTLQVLADQLATAVYSARILRDAQEALISARKASGDISKRGWQTLVQDIDIPGYIGLAHGGLVQTTEILDPRIINTLEQGELILSEDRRSISVPIIARGQTIGMARLVKPSHAKPWAQDEITDIELIASQISSALESARLFSDAQRRATKERIISEGATRVSAALDVESVLQATAEELERALGSSEVVIQIDSQE